MTLRSLSSVPFASWFRKFTFPFSPTALLLIATAAALVWANAFGIRSYRSVWEFHRSWLPGTPKEWVNDGLMALFFLLIGIEIKRELTVGALNTSRHALLPAAAALGGMAVPAGIYLALNWSGQGRAGWGIPMATDIAFALGILGALGSYASASGRIFLTALAVVDDIGAMLVIAIFYSVGVSIPLLIAMAAVAIAMQVMSRSGKFGPFPVLLVGVVLWACALKSGIHPTLAGLAVGLLLPAQAGSDDLERLEHMVEPFVSRVIVPLFALANAGIVVTGGWSILTNRIALGVFLGLVLGKPIGIMSATLVTRFVTKNTGGELGSSRGLVGFTVLGGVGFTMSLFIAELAFDASERADAAKLGILAASTVAAISGFVLLRRAPAV